MQIMCSKGCGVPLVVTSEVLEEARKNRVATLDVSHDVCPRDRVELPQYTFSIKFTRNCHPNRDEVVELAAVQHTVEGPSFAIVWPEILAGIAAKLEAIEGMCVVAEGDL